MESEHFTDFTPVAKVTLKDLNSKIIKTQYAVRGPIPARAEELKLQLEKDPKSLPFNKIINANIGNPQQLGQKPLSFIRKVLSILQYPDILEDESKLQTLIELRVYQKDVVRRARKLLGEIGGSVGAYSLSQGVPGIQQTVADYITKRDSGEVAYPEDIFLTTGASSAVSFILPMFCNGPTTGVLIPIPQYPLYTATITLVGATAISYYLNEEDNWSVNTVEMENTIQESIKSGIKPTTIVIINPGNPTGSILTEKDIANIIRISAKYGLLIIADEVYQENVFSGNEFHSVKKVLRKLQRKYLGFYETVQLASLHSTSKGLIGECGQRGGYMELIGLTDDVRLEVVKLMSISICSVVTGQALIDMVVSPPRPGDESYEMDQLERNNIKNDLISRSQKLHQLFISLEGVECLRPQGAMYLFPKFIFPQKFIDIAQKLHTEADTLYCKELLEHTGICTVPGSGFGQKPNTYHLRTTFLVPGDSWIDLWRKFHTEFCERYRS
ncbi:hypothetical protein TPHA_0A01800 [Tetrapisispora phaffii CBS 4417]|uniref:Aminotransferase class I/classII large domain-containing protein n=1 Tax=Tetrapisispora phaffii (strain ATCC 24235 / CBS 4417 / NBRC 1672 / NRRL Y-8282 / UCD 70-5) TaxID=1071381 RepID=G8BMY5_TETPH|nr:hypothetical protein TPHA_0A01800 [Tetrapisispora phaffii CBS 4417]CCE61263.1 hypothetical protein TPHA_0A01800 [Tetrapisispora phaffii CBS 4417]